MFNKWLKKQKSTSADEKDYDELVDSYEDELDDDYYYYYYYEDDYDGEVEAEEVESTIPLIDENTQDDDEKNYDGDSYGELNQFYANASFDNNNQVVDNQTESEEVEEIEDDSSVIKDPVDNQLDLTSENKELKQQIEQLISQNDILMQNASKLERLEKENEQLKVLEFKYQKSIENKDKQLTEQTANFEKLQQEVQAGQSEIEKYQTSIAEKDNTIAELKQTLEIKEEDILLLANESNEKDETLQQLKDSLENKQNFSPDKELELEDLRKQLLEKTQTINNQSERIQQLLSDNKQLSETLEHANVELEELREVQQTITELQEKLQQTQKLAQEYKNTQGATQDSNGKRNKIEQELTIMTENFEQQIQKTEELENELNKLRENKKIIEDLELEINNMRSQQERLTENLTDITNDNSRVQELEREIQRLQSQSSPDVAALQDELRRTKEELYRVRTQKQYVGMNQADIAQVMIEAQAKAREIVEAANQEAKRRIVDAETELSTISQEAKNYYRKLETIKYESETVFSDLLHKLEKIGEVDRLK